MYEVKSSFAFSYIVLLESVSRDDGGFDVAIPVEHMVQHRLQPRQGRLARNVVSALDLPLRD